MKKTRHILEVGHGGYPIGHTNLKFFSSKIPQNTLYHGIDLPSNMIHTIEEFNPFFLV